MPPSPATSRAVVPLRLRETETLAAIEAHWRVYGCAPSLARLDAFLGRPAWHFRQLQVRGYISLFELRLTGKGARRVYPVPRDPRMRRRAA